jgi:hypothetical protein
VTYKSTVYGVKWEIPIEKGIDSGSTKNICFIRLMSTWNEQFGALELVREKNRLGRGSNLGSQGGNLSLWGPERFFSVVGIAIDIPIIRKSPKKK